MFAVLLACLFGIPFGLAQNTVHVSWRWWPILIWSLVVLLAAALLLFEWRRRRVAFIPSSSLSVDQLGAQIVALEAILEMCVSDIGPDAPITASARKSLAGANRRMAALQSHLSSESSARTTTPADTGADADSLTLRIAGVVIIALPLVLVIGSAIGVTATLPWSVSEYYYTSMRGILVGGFCAFGILLVRAQSNKAEMFLTTIAGILMIASALVPTTPIVATHAEIIIGSIHLMLISTVTILAGTICLYYFSRGGGNQATWLKPARAAICRVCGALILLLVITVFASSWFPSTPVLASAHLTLWAEVAFLIAFGIACIARSGAVTAEQAPSGWARDRSELAGDGIQQRAGAGPSESDPKLTASE